MSSAIASLSQPYESGVPSWDAAGEGCAAPSAERRLRMLDRLAEAGLEIALAIERQVKAAEPAPALAELNAAAMAYARAARAVRLAVLLQAQLSGGDEEPPEALEEAARRAEAERRKAHIRRAERIVERVAREHCGKGPTKAAAYAYEARERLDDDDIYGLVATRPVGELVALICRDLGLQPDWEVLAEEAWAQAEIASGAQGSPFLEDDDDDDLEGAEEPEPGPEPPVCRPRSFQDRLQALARDPEIIAAARRGSG